MINDWRDFKLRSRIFFWVNEQASDAKFQTDSEFGQFLVNKLVNLRSVCRGTIVKLIIAVSTLSRAQP
jgi:hypothetical protein